MRNPDQWRPTKFVDSPRGLRASRDPTFVGWGSRFLVDCSAQAYVELLQTYACGTLLDLGCGDVPLYGVYRHRVKRTICIDWAESYHGNLHWDCIADLNQGIPLADACVDTILCTSVLEHMREPWTLLAEMDRVLRLGGHVLLSVPFLYPLHESPHDYFRYTEYGLRYFCERLSWEVKELLVLGGRREVFCDLVGKTFGINAVTRLLGRLTTASVRLLTGRFGVARRAAGCHFPVAYFLVGEKGSKESAR